LALFPMSDLTAEAAPDSTAPTGWSGVTLACTVDSRDDVDSAFDAAVSAGATPVAAATDRSWGGFSAFIADPEGNRWEITWSPRARYDARSSSPWPGGCARAGATSLDKPSGHHVAPTP